MNPTFEDSSSNFSNRIFLLSAMGSAILHAAILAGLTYLPSPPTIKEPTPTVQVTLVPAVQEISSAPQAPTKPLTPTRPDLAQPTPPPTAAQPTPSLPAPPLQASINPTRSKPLSPPPIPQKQPMLKDTRTDQAIKSRQMMKMAPPLQHQQRPLHSPAPPRREQPIPRTPYQQNTREPRIQHALPPPSNPTAARPALKTPTPMTAGSTTSGPKIVASSKPLYPRVARESGWVGTVIVRTLIAADGAPSEVEVRKSSGHEMLDLAAQEAIKNWKFQPAKDGNIPIAKWVDIPVKFDLNS